MGRKILKAHYTLLTCPSNARSLGSNMSSAAWTARASSFDETVLLPKFFQAVFQNTQDWGSSEEITELLSNNVTLDRRVLVVGDRYKPDSFFCAQIDDEDLPWDVNQIEW